MANDLMVRDSMAVMLDERTMKVASILAKSTLVPSHFKNNPGNCLIALNFAARSGADPLLIMQSMYMVHNKPALETKLLVALFNSDGRFSPLEYVYSEDRQECRCYATQLSSKSKLEGPVVSIAMSKKEGWYSKNGSKWQTMPETMLGYRAAAFFIRRYAPEVTFGMQTTDEVIDMIDNKKGSYQMIEEEIAENANKKMIDIPQDGALVDAEYEPIPEPEQKEVKEPPKNTCNMNQAKQISGLEKKAGRDKSATLTYMSGFVDRKIEKYSDLTANEATEYISMLTTELADVPEENSGQEEPPW